jgi:hypothetical protein
VAWYALPYTAYSTAYSIQYTPYSYSILHRYAPHCATGSVFVPFACGVTSLPKGKMMRIIYYYYDAYNMR